MSWLSKLIDGDEPRDPQIVKLEREQSRQDRNLQKRSMTQGGGQRSGTVAKAIMREAARRGVKKPTTSYNTSSGPKAVYPAGRGMEVVVTFDSQGRVVSQVEQGIIHYGDD